VVLSDRCNTSGVNLIRDRFTGQSRGFAFVEVNSDEDADRAVNSLNGQNFGGRNLVVNEARPQAERAGGGGGRGGGGGDMAVVAVAWRRTRWPRWWRRTWRRIAETEAIAAIVGRASTLQAAKRLSSESG